MNDIVIAVDGENVEGLDGFTVSMLLTNRPPGSTVEVTVRRGEATQAFVVEVAAVPAPEETNGFRDSLQHQRDVIERSVIQRALMNNGYSRSRAADSLGISRVTLYKKMKKFGLMKRPIPSGV